MRPSSAWQETSSVMLKEERACSADEVPVKIQCQVQATTEDLPLRRTPPPRVQPRTAATTARAPVALLTTAPTTEHRRLLPPRTARVHPTATLILMSHPIYHHLLSTSAPQLCLRRGFSLEVQSVPMASTRTDRALPRPTILLPTLLRSRFPFVSDRVLSSESRRLSVESSRCRVPDRVTGRVFSLALR